MCTCVSDVCVCVCATFIGWNLSTHANFLWWWRWRWWRCISTDLWWMYTIYYVLSTLYPYCIIIPHRINKIVGCASADWMPNGIEKVIYFRQLTFFCTSFSQKESETIFITSCFHQLLEYVCVCVSVCMGRWHNSYLIALVLANLFDVYGWSQFSLGYSKGGIFILLFISFSIQ